MLQKRRVASDYGDIATHLLNHYPCELAYFVAVDINERFESRVGYPPLGQIMVALHERGGENAARWIACALLNFPRIELAQRAFSVIRSAQMSSLVRGALAEEEPQIAEYICVEPTGSPAPLPQPSLPEGSERREAIPANEDLSDGIARMPRRLTDAERRGDRLFLHLQAASLVVALALPILGGVLRGWPGAAIGLLTGWLARAWMRRSMGLRGSDPHEGFFIRMRERASGSRPGLLELLVEHVRRRSFTQAQCVAITEAWEEARRRLFTATSVDEKRAVVDQLDALVKRISYGQDA